MKECVSLEDVKKYINKDKNTVSNLIKLAKAIRKDYEGVMGYYIVFEKKDKATALELTLNYIPKHYSIDTMKHILDRYNINININNSAVTVISNNITYDKGCLCDTLWYIVTNYVLNKIN